jgi:hypothetical protein
MLNIKTKIAAASASAIILSSVLTSGAFAANTVIIKGNGAGSHNFVGGFSLKKMKVKQHNVTVANTAVVSAANTGGNKTNGNTGGTTTSNTGNATSKVTVTVTGGDNSATLPDCGCPNGTNDVTIQGNGKNSTNVVLGGSIDSTSVHQGNATIASTWVVSTANTGGNQTNGNTGGGATSDTGNANSTVEVSVSGGNNTLN